eukprot:PhF_6_TR19005/c0_g1_i1/m.27853
MGFELSLTFRFLLGVLIFIFTLCATNEPKPNGNSRDLPSSFFKPSEQMARRNKEILRKILPPPPSPLVLPASSYGVNTSWVIHLQEVNKRKKTFHRPAEEAENTTLYSRAAHRRYCTKEPSLPDSYAVRVYYRYKVGLGFFNQLASHLTASVLVRARAKPHNSETVAGLYGVLLPYAVQKYGDSGWYDRYCALLSSMFDLNTLKQSWSSLGVKEFIHVPCPGGRKGTMLRKNKPKNDMEPPVGPNKSNPIPLLLPEYISSSNVTYMNEVITDSICDRKQKFDEKMKKQKHDSVAKQTKLFNAMTSFDIPWGMFHIRGLNDFRRQRLPPDVIEHFRAAARNDWKLNDELQSYVKEMVGNLRVMARGRQIIFWHLRAEIDRMWESPETQVNEFHAYIRYAENLRLEDPNCCIVYVGSGVESFQRNKTTLRVTAVKSGTDHTNLRLPTGGYCSEDVITSYERKRVFFEELSFEHQAAVQFFVALEMDVVVSVSGSSWGMGIAQYRMLLRDNPRTRLIGLKAKDLMLFHAYFYDTFPKAFCDRNGVECK